MDELSEFQLFVLEAAREASERAKARQELALEEIRLAGRERALAVKAALNAGVSKKDVADALGIARPVIYRILKNLD